MGFSQAVSGLNAASSNLDVIGNNIANSATSGFKAGSVSFADMFAGSQTGMGVKVAGITQDFNDGTTTTTNRRLDLAISQNGFFRMQDSTGGIFYARNGQFKLDENRNIVNMQGLNLTGYPATGTPPTVQQGANPIPLSIPQGMIPAKATTAGNMVANLTSTHDIIPADTTSGGVTTPTFDPDKPDTYSFVNNMTTFDSLGNRHEINVFYVKRSEDAVNGNSWDVYTRDSSAVPAQVAEKRGSMLFDTNGALKSVTNGTNAASTTDFNMTIPMGVVNGAPAQEFALNVAGSKQQNTGTDSIVTQNQTGYAAGEFTGFQINNDGSVVGTYSNQQTQLLGQIVMVNFANPEGLSSEGNNVWKETLSSGNAILGTAGSGGFGTLTSGALESSNVDLSKELVNMIVAQRNYQSNAQTIKTQDQILQTLVNLR
ncbi:flagellar hook-basal body family protein [Yersinia rochesterensis]|uniref:Flagellar hook protein FlgE n=1 Tax=Yersinia rochesterensis TaxID=1604335 RepID=A0A386HD77_9GAMM|nr:MULTISPECIES: flagellar hook protein FlgE [Yersinia]AJI86851.1 flagellar hook protein flgE [Yersinia frederiksenii Y225]CNH50605.1 flagellar hook protein FlgE [Yersinia kristensenii]AIN17046.1 flagellar hook-basal body family protein [Yersinia rochesterensis]AJJ35983.1 flagellar hook-basal body family protein [Yersinia rochesterensis]AYD43757.1 flagellar hook protein FlgE [Yersinia rochesterensis]